VFGIDLAGAADDRFGQVRVQGVFTPGVPRAQDVQARPRDHRGQPAAEVVHPAGVGAAETEPGVLDGVVGVGE
jgi:hypothetical protein